MITFKNVSKKYLSGKTVVTAVENINLEIKEGQFVAIIGPSGSGKSTLLNLLGGLDTPSEGSIIIHDKDISEYSDRELSKYRNTTIGFVFQEFHLEPFLTVRKNVLLPVSFSQNGKGSASHAEQLIKEVELSGKIDSKVTELSGGQKQRAAIARALINHPKIIIADEPTGNLDSKTGEIIIELLKKLHKSHKVTLIIATHDPKIAHAADKITHIEDGRIKN